MFWEFDHRADLCQRVYDASTDSELTGQDFFDLVVRWEDFLQSDRRQLVALLCDNSVTSIAVYLAALRSGQTIMLSNATTDPTLQRRLCDIYQPEIVISVGEPSMISKGYRVTSAPSAGVTVACADAPAGDPIAPETAVLLSTSGTTGSPKLIRLSYQNLQSNAEAIVHYLEITAGDTAITTLPLSYSYGLSVVNSHLLAGANLVCTNASIMTREFWAQFSARQCTSFAGVPFSYNMLERLRFEQMSLPSLRTMTQAGGRLAPDKVRLFADMAKRKDRRFFVMYGQSEATARISYVPWERLTDKIGSIGVPIPNGHLMLMRNEQAIVEPYCEGELVYAGPNVMLGYAETRASLSKGDESAGVLYTGDLGYRDADGYFYVTGRMKRFIKVFGLRLNLDEAEKMLETTLGYPVACAGRDEGLHVLVEAEDDAVLAETQRQIVSLYKLHHSSIRVRRVDALPVTASGKKDYHAAEYQFD